VSCVLSYAPCSWDCFRLFLAGNGVKQGGTLRPVLLCLYIDGLLLVLSRAGVRCFVGSHFVGVLAYTQMILL